MGKLGMEENIEKWPYDWDPKDFFIVYDRKIKIIMNFLRKADEEISDIFRFQNQDKKDVISASVQLILVFTFIDIVANYYHTYLGTESSSHTKKFYDFIENFCFTEKNTYFNKRKHMKNVTASDLKNLRNGLVHFYGIGTQKNIVLASNGLEDNEILNILNKNSINKKPIVVIPVELYEIVQGGTELFFENFSITEEHTAQEKIEKMYAVDRILEKINKEGGIHVVPV
jgi:hypothetical protein